MHHEVYSGDKVGSRLPCELTLYTAMAKLEDLPDDLILAILQHVPSYQLLPLATVSKRLHRCSVDRIYHSVYPWESPARNIQSKYAEVPDITNWSNSYVYTLNAGSGPPLSYDTRIFHLSRFLRTVSESESLCLLVARASFDIQAHQEEVSSQVIELLAPSLKNLHVKRTLASHDSKAKFLPAVSSLEIEINECTDIDSNSSDLKFEANKERLRSLFDLPRLERLCLSGVRNWKLLVEDSEIKRSGTSNITSLSLNGTIPVDKGIAEVLSWPKKLKSLHYEPLLSEIHRRSWGPAEFFLRVVRLSARAFGVALASQ